MKTQWAVHASSHLRCHPIMCSRFPRILLSANHQPPPLTRCRPWCISVRAAATLCVPAARACSNTSHDGVCIDSGQVGWHERCGVVGVASPTAGITRGGRQPSCPTPRPGPASSGRCQPRLQRGRTGAGPLGTGRAPAVVVCCHALTSHALRCEDVELVCSVAGDQSCEWHGSRMRSWSHCCSSSRPLRGDAPCCTCIVLRLEPPALLMRTGGARWGA